MGTVTLVPRSAKPTVTRVSLSVPFPSQSAKAASTAAEATPTATPARKMPALSLARPMRSAATSEPTSP